MNPNSILFALINAAAFMLSAGFIMYVALIVVPYLRYKAAEGIDPEEVSLGVVDADGFLAENCLRAVSGPKYFGNSGISAVQIEVRVNNDKTESDSTPWRRLLVQLQDMEFTTVIAAIQLL